MLAFYAGGLLLIAAVYGLSYGARTVACSLSRWAVSWRWSPQSLIGVGQQALAIGQEARKNHKNREGGCPVAERPDQIEQHIASTRNELGNNLQELEDKVKQAADWRTYYERNPMTDGWARVRRRRAARINAGRRRRERMTRLSRLKRQKRGLSDWSCAKRPSLRTLAKRKDSIDRAIGGKNSRFSGRSYSRIQRALRTRRAQNPGASATSSYSQNREYEVPSPSHVTSFETRRGQPAACLLLI